MKYKLKQTSQFKKDYKLAKKQGQNLSFFYNAAMVFKIRTIA